MIAYAQFCVPQRFPVDRPLEDDLGRWVVARVKPRHEKAVAARLALEGIGYYLPAILHTHRRPDNGKPRKAFLPLFPGYLSFVGEENRGRLREAGSVLQFLSVLDQDRFVRELAWVRRILQLPCGPAERPMIPLGARVRVTRGPLRGVEGILERTRSKCRLWVGVEFFQRHVLVELPEEVLALVEEAAPPPGIAMGGTIHGAANFCGRTA